MSNAAYSYVICLAEGTNGHNQLPAWTPDWTDTTGIIPLQGVLQPGSDRLVFSASSDIKPVVRFLQGTDVLICQGFLSGVVTNSGSSPAIRVVFPYYGNTPHK